MCCATCAGAEVRSLKRALQRCKLTRAHTAQKRGKTCIAWRMAARPPTKFNKILGIKKGLMRLAPPSFTACKLAAAMSSSEPMAHPKEMPVRSRTDVT